MQRRDFLPTLVTAGLAAAQVSVPARIARKGRLKQSCFDRVFGSGMPLEEMCREAARLGAVGFDAQSPEAWPTLKRFGLTPTLARGGGISIEAGIIHEQMHSDLVRSIGELIDLCAVNGCPSILIVGGQRNGMSYAEGATHANAFLNRVKSHAEQKNVTLCLEVMNSKYADPALGRTRIPSVRSTWTGQSHSAQTSTHRGSKFFSTSTISRSWTETSLPIFRPASP